MSRNGPLVFHVVVRQIGLCDLVAEAHRRIALPMLGGAIPLHLPHVALVRLGVRPEAAHLLVVCERGSKAVRVEPPPRGCVLQPNEGALRDGIALWAVLLRKVGRKEKREI